MRPYKILICEDDSYVREMVTAIVHDILKYEVVSIPNGKEIVKGIYDNHPDLILLDYWLPDFNADKLLRWLKTNDKTKNIPVILISSDLQVKKLAFDAGADDFLPKPFNVEKLEERINKYIPKQV